MVKNNVRLLGDYIRQVDIRNINSLVTNLLGVSIQKQFIPSIANIVGTDLSNYKVVEHGQFAYGPVTSRNGDKISIAYLEEEKCIVSSSYTVFEVIKKNLLNPEYLMLWFSRPEFDREASFIAVGGVRGSMPWNEFSSMVVPVPSIERQQEIVNAYRAIKYRIALKQRINDNLAA